MAQAGFPKAQPTRRGLHVCLSADHQKTIFTQKLDPSNDWKGWEAFKRKQPPKYSVWMGQETTKRLQSTDQHRCSSQTSLSFLRRGPGWFFAVQDTKLERLGRHFPRRPDRTQAHSPGAQHELHGAGGVTVESQQLETGTGCGSQGHTNPRKSQARLFHTARW